MSNNTWKPFVLTLLVVAALLALFYVPRFSLSGHEMRRVNLLSDIQQLGDDGRVLAEVRADAADGFMEQSLDTAAVMVKHVAYVDSVPEGMTAIEDFSEDDERRMMDHFYSALSEAGTRPVRIAYFGDSYIEGDILTAHLRDHLQKIFGGQGVGFVDIHSETAGFRTTVAAKAKGWISHNANDERSQGFRKELQGINGRYFIPTSTATMELKCTPGKMGQRLAKAEVATIYYTAGAGLQLQAAINDEELSLLADPSLTLPSMGGNAIRTATPPHRGGGAGGEGLSEEVHTIKTMHIDTIYTVEPDSQNPHGVYTLDTTYTEHEQIVRTGEQSQGSITHQTVQGDIARFRLSVTSGESSRFYGVALDGKTGIALDNYSMRASNGWKLMDIPLETLKAFQQQRPYDLIVLQYGLNIANHKQVDYSWYIKRMKQCIEYLKAAFPSTSILVVSVGDRDERGTDGQYHTMRGIQELVQFQRKMAADTHVAFWNLYEAMGGDGSLAAMVEQHQANLDYTHINFAGGRHLATLLYDVLMNGKENYDKRTK